MTEFWCEHALVGDSVRPGVTVGVEGGRVTAIDFDTTPTSSTTTLAGLSLPGFANAHSHAFHRALRSRVQAERGTFWTWRDIMYRAAAQLDPDNYFRLARAVFAEMAMAGMTVVGEFHYVHHQLDGTPYDDPNAMGEALLAAADEAGIRITLLDTLYLHGGLDTSGYTAPSGTQVRYSDRSAEQWARRVDPLHDSDRHRIGAAIHSVRAVDPESMRVAVEWAKGRGAPLHVHVSEQVAENEQCEQHHGCTPVALLGQVGALGANCTAIHATHLTATDIELLGQHTCAVCMCPTTERDLGDGIGPTPELAAAGVSISLGSDSQAAIDHMIEARAVELDERLRAEQRGVHSAAELMHMATVAGHTGLGWNDAGVIAVGNRADLVTISLATERTAGTPADLLIEAAVFASTASDITSVVADGEQIVIDGQHRTLDVPAELASSITAVLP